MLLGCLDGHHSVDDLEAAGSAAGLSSGRGVLALHRLREAGLLHGPGSRPDRRDHRIRLIGAGPVGLAVARQLVDRGIAALYVFDADAPRSGSVPHRRAAARSGDGAVLGRR